MKKVKESFDTRKLIPWVEKFSNVPVLVVGDVMMDRSLRGNVERISPEAPVPVVDVKEDKKTAGGAGNVVFNIQALGGKPTLLSILGPDGTGREIRDEFLKKSLDVSGLLIDPSRPTTTKTRIIAGHQQVVRFDVESRAKLDSRILSQLINRLKELAPKFPVILISDYGKGLVTPPVIAAAMQMSRKHGLSVIVDPKIEHFLQYKGVDCLTPNTKEAIEGIRTLPPKDETEFEALGWKIVKKLKSHSLLITRGEKGMMLFEKNGRLTVIPTQAREVFDVTGAGDTVVSTFSLARAVGAPYEIAARISNYAASIVVAKLGTATASQEELTSLLRNRR